MSIDYEWDVETLDSYKDIVDHDHGTLKMLKLNYYPMMLNQALVLVRTQRGDHYDRQWAYVSDSGVLPDTFDGGTPVPARFKKADLSWTKKLEQCHAQHLKAGYCTRTKEHPGCHHAQDGTDWDRWSTGR